MEKLFKRVYIEILNYCNLNCPFCVKTSKEAKKITLTDFTHILDEIKPYTDYIYLHVQGEPLLHPQINEMIEIAYNKGFKINLTTNGTLLDNLTNFRYLRQINISLQSMINKNIDSLAYYDKIIDLIKNNENTYISLRIWGNFEAEKIISYFETKLDKHTIISKNGKSHKLTDHVFFSLDDEFSWPSLDMPINSCKGTCQGTISHVAILVDGTVVPCCLDKDGIIELGNIYQTTFSEIIKSERFNSIRDNFKKHIVTEELCQKCTYRNRFN